VVATSTTEAEYIVIRECVKKALWIKNIFMELFNIARPFKLMTDNISSKTTLENGENNVKLKHIDIKISF